MMCVLVGGGVGLDCQSGGGVSREEGATVVEECVVAVEVQTTFVEEPARGGLYSSVIKTEV
jgi:hypothetical protein